jgi:oligosaccharide repeat unit polymerase
VSAAAPTLPALDYGRLRIPMAAFEVLAYLTVVSAASLAFVAGWLTVNGAVVLTVILLAALVVLSWIHLGQGRHPVFLFLCTLTLFQGGRLIGYCLGAEPHPMRFGLMGSSFDIPREQQGIALFCVVMAALCVYLPSRWRYCEVPPINVVSMERYLPYLYLVFALTWPVQLFKNYKYFEYVVQHGGYLALFFNHSAVTATVPFVVRAVALLPFPVFIAIFVFESRRRYLWITATLYVISTSVMLLMGSRGGIVTLVLTLWWITRIKSEKSPKIVYFVAVGIVLLLIGDFVRQSREDTEMGKRKFMALEAISIEGAPLNMTELAIHSRRHFAQYSGSYIYREFKSAFVALDNLHYQSGESLDLDASALLNPVLVRQGNRVASSYIGEAYIAGGIAAVVLASLGIGVLLTAFYNHSNRPTILLLAALTLQDILIMPRAQLFDWLSVVIRNLLLVGIVTVGWFFYSLVTSVKAHRDHDDDPVFTRAQT